MWKIISQDERAVFGRHGPLVVAVVRASIDAPFFDRLGALLDDADDERVSVLLVRAGSSPSGLPADLRERARSVLGGHADRIRGFAYVNAGSGLKAKLLRGAMNAVLLTASFQAKVFVDPSSALAWLIGLPGQPATLRGAEADIRDVVSTLSS